MRDIIIFSVATLVTAVTSRVMHNPFAFLNESEPEFLKSIKLPELAAIEPENKGVWKPPLPANDQQWQHALCKGKTLLEGMRVSDYDAGQLLTPPRTSARSDFNDFPQTFATWNYHLYDAENVGDDFGKFDQFWGVGRALRDLGVSDKSMSRDAGSNLLLFLSHGNAALSPRTPYRQQKYVVDSKTYESTGAFFAYSLNAEDGVIMAMHREAPQYAVRNWDPPMPKDGLPKLSRASDILWGLWKPYADEDIKNFRYFFSLSVTNELTDRILTRATGGEVAPWPGVTFYMHQEEARALLGTPNSVSIGFFLMQHKEELGLLWIFAVRVFHCDTAHKTPCLLYYVTNKWLDEVPGVP